MDTTTLRARITGPIFHRSHSGPDQNVPIGPCLVEIIDGQSIEIIWGASGQSSMALSIEEMRAAREHGNLVLLD